MSSLTDHEVLTCKKSMKVLQEQSESYIEDGQTHNSKRKSTKGQTTSTANITHKTKDE